MRYCHDCPPGTLWVITSGGRGLPEGWSRWRCKGCKQIGMGDLKVLKRDLKLLHDKLREQRIEEMELKRSEHAKGPYKNTWAKRYKGRG